MLMVSYANLSSEQNYGTLLIEYSEGGIVTLWALAHKNIIYGGAIICLKYPRRGDLFERT